MPTHKQIRLIVNADDYGYSPCISRGIVEAARQGAVTATGLLANGPGLEEQLKWLDTVDYLDLGVHLNLSWGMPLTPRLSKKLSAFDGRFPSVHQMSLLLMRGKVSLQDVRNEWSAQIEVCGSSHGKPVFLNSHEHIHMLPWLFPLTIDLAKASGIPHIRLSRADWMRPIAAGSWVRNAMIQGMYMVNCQRIASPVPIFLGLGRSGKLSLDYVEKLFSFLRPDKTYELMCHPGRYDPNEITDDKLKAYHDWEGELSLLKSPALQDLYAKFNIHLSRY